MNVRGMTSSSLRTVKLARLQYLPGVQLRIHLCHNVTVCLQAAVTEGQAAHSLKLQDTLNPEEFLTFELLKLEFLVNTRILKFKLYVSVTVHREQACRKNTNKMQQYRLFIVNSRC